VVRRPPSDFIGVYSYQYWSKPSVGKTTNHGGGKRRGALQQAGLVRHPDFHHSFRASLAATIGARHQGWLLVSVGTLSSVSVYQQH